MARKGSDTIHQLTIDARRRLVVSLYLRGGYTLNQMAALMSLPDDRGEYRMGGINPDTEQRWDVGTLSRDLTALKKQWRDEAKADVGEHVTRILGELKEVRQEAWRHGKLNQVMMAIDREMKVLGIGQGDDLPDPLEQVQYASREEYNRAMEEQYRRNMGDRDLDSGDVKN